MARASGRKRSSQGSSGRQTLWAPWRSTYIQRGAPESGCLFCRVRRARTDRAHLVLARRPHAFVVLNRFPYNPGHLMVAVARHAGRFRDLTANERHDLDDLLALAETALEREYRPHGFNTGTNHGRVAGAGFVGHLHIHVVPRWNGDTNFMPVIGETKVLPESLDATWRRLRPGLRELDSPRPGRRR